MSSADHLGNGHYGSQLAGGEHCAIRLHLGPIYNAGFQAKSADGTPTVPISGMAGGG